MIQRMESRLFHQFLAAMLVVAAVGARQPIAPPQIRVATGSGLAALPEVKGPFFDITKFGAQPNGPAKEHTSTSA